MRSDFRIACGLAAAVCAVMCAGAQEEGGEVAFAGINFSENVNIRDEAPVAKDDPVRYQPLRMIPTPVRVAKQSLSLTVSGGVLTDTEASMEGDHKDKTTTRNTFIRLKLKQVQTKAAPVSAAVAVQNFVKYLGVDGRLVPVETNLFLIHLPALGGQGTWVDLPPITTVDIKSTRNRVESNRAQSSTTGLQYIGSIVTVFVNTNIALQQTSNGSLKDLGVTEVPMGPR